MLPVESAQRRPIVCFEFSDFVEQSDWLHDLTFVLSCVQLVLLARNIGMIFLHAKYAEQK